MLFVGGEMLMDEEQRLLFDAMVADLKALKAASDPADPWLFHGTSQAAGEAIVANGFDPSTSAIRVDGEAFGGKGRQACVFWTTDVEMADKFAGNKSSPESGFPVFLVARLSDVVRSGIPVPDLYTWECDCDSDPDAKPVDWRHSLDSLGALAVVDCRHVEGLKLWSFAPMDVRPVPSVVAANVTAALSSDVAIPDGSTDDTAETAAERPAFAL